MKTKQKRTKIEGEECCAWCRVNKLFGKVYGELTDEDLRNDPHKIWVNKDKDNWKEQLIQRVEGMKKPAPSWYIPKYNQAIDDVISLLKEL